MRQNDMIWHEWAWFDMNEHDLTRTNMIWLEWIWLPNILDSKMIGKVKHPMMMINEVNTMTPRQNEFVVKN